MLQDLHEEQNWAESIETLKQKIQAVPGPSKVAFVSSRSLQGETSKALKPKGVKTKQKIKIQPNQGGTRIMNLAKTTQANQEKTCKPLKELSPNQQQIGNSSPKTQLFFSKKTGLQPSTTSASLRITSAVPQLTKPPFLIPPSLETI